MAQHLPTHPSMGVTFVALIFLCICAILLGAVSTPPIKWVVVVCAVIALILVVLGGLPIGGAVVR